MRSTTADPNEARAAAPRWLVLLVMCTGYFLVLLDVTIVNVALPSISEGLRASVSSLQWVVDGYAIALAALMLTGGGVGDLWGHKREPRPPEAREQARAIGIWAGVRGSALVTGSLLTRSTFRPSRSR